MRLKNKRTGEIIEFDAMLIVKDVMRDSVAHLEYGSLTDLNEEWEDYGEPKGYFYIRDGGNIDYCRRECSITERHESIGNYFKTKEEAEEAVEKLKAWKRLKDKGFKWGLVGGRDVEFSYPDDCRNDKSFWSDIDLFFGGGE